VDGSLQTNEAGNLNFNSGAAVTGRVYVPGTPSIKVNGQAVEPLVSEGVGDPSPANGKIILNNDSDIAEIVTRTDSIPLEEVVEPRRGKKGSFLDS